MEKASNNIHFSLAISSDEYRRYYQGNGRYVVARSWDGRTVQFPAGWLSRFLSHDGIYGDFVICYDDNHKLISLERMKNR